MPDLVQPLHRRRTRFVKQPKLLPHYPAVVEWVYSHRYVASFQIQRRFNDFMPSQRTSQYQLARLVDLGFLQQAPVRSTSPNFPAVFAATQRGIGLVKRTYAELGIEWEGAATEQLKSSGLALDSVLHEVMLTQFDLAVRDAVASRGDLTLLLHERRYFRRDKRLEYEFQGRRHCLIPDAGFLLRLTTRRPGKPDLIVQRLQMNFVEFDNGSLSKARLAAKYAAYHEWSSDAGQDFMRQLNQRYGGGEERFGFRLLVIAHSRARGSDDRRLIELLTLALEFPRTMRERIWLTTVADLQGCPYDDPARLTPIWRRLRDCRAWLPTYRSIPTGREGARLTRRSEFVAKQLQSAPRYPLLPQ